MPKASLLQNENVHKKEKRICKVSPSCKPFPIFEKAHWPTVEDLLSVQVKVHKGRKELGHVLEDSKTAIEELNRLVSGILIVIMIIVWLILTEIVTTKILVFLSSQLVVAAFMFGNTCKTVFEALIFVFVMHPFDVGDRCVVDGVQVLSTS